MTGSSSSKWSPTFSKTQKDFLFGVSTLLLLVAVWGVAYWILF